MANNLAGTQFIWRGVDMDYPFIESINSMLEYCDHVFVLAGGDDQSYEAICDQIPEKHLTVRRIMPTEWESQTGREKLAYFTNLSIRMAQREGFEWQINCQSDELAYPECYGMIRTAIEKKDAEAFYVKRINFWGDCFHYLNVAQDRQPVGTRIIRLARTFYPSVDDAESVLAPASLEHEHDIRIGHFGFIRDPKKHLVKIRHIQEDIFGFEHADRRIDGLQEFDYKLMGFTKQDLSWAEEPLPPLIKKWCSERYDREKSVELWKTNQ